MTTALQHVESCEYHAFLLSEHFFIRSYVHYKYNDRFFDSVHFFTDSLFFQPNRTKKCGKFVFIHFHLYIFTGVLCDTRIVWMYLLNKINLISIIPISICSIFSNSLRILLDFLILFLLPFSVLAFAFVERFYLFHWLCILSVFFSYFLHSLI